MKDGAQNDAYSTTPLQQVHYYYSPHPLYIAICAYITYLSHKGHLHIWVSRNIHHYNMCHHFDNSHPGKGL